MARPDTTPHARNDPPARPGGGGDLNFTTLAIAAAASAAAAFVTSQVWAGGTLWSAAMTPVIVALVKEGLSRPAEKVKTARGTRGGAYESMPREPEGDMSPVTVYGSAPRRRSRAGDGPDGGVRARLTPKRIRLAVITGLLAFAVVVVAYTVPELVSGSSLGGGGDNRTTLFGGTPRKARERATPTPTPTPTPAAEESATAEPDGDATAAPTVTPTVTATPTPAATPPGGLAAPAATPTPTAAP